MSRDWATSFEAWGSPPSEAEETERKRTEAEIVAALRAHRPLQDKNINVYAKGSYRRGTNVRRGSDVDVAVELLGDEATGESFITEKLFEAANLTDADLGLHSVAFAYSVSQLKRDVYDALVAAFGERAVTWSNKCIKIREKATTLPADVIASRTHRRYDSRSRYFNGIEIHPDRGAVIVNWPRQDDDNGLEKNKRTSLRFKRAVRGIKSLENEMVDEKFIEVVPSFMMECAVYNVSDHRFDRPDNYSNCLTALEIMAEAARDPDVYGKWLEVNELKYLFGAHQSWSVDDMLRLVNRSAAYLRAGG